MGVKEAPLLKEYIEQRQRQRYEHRIHEFFAESVGFAEIQAAQLPFHGVYYTQPPLHRPIAVTTAILPLYRCWRTRSRANRLRCDPRPQAGTPCSSSSSQVPRHQASTTSHPAPPRLPKPPIDMSFRSAGAGASPTAGRPCSSAPAHLPVCPGPLCRKAWLSRAARPHYTPGCHRGAQITHTPCCVQAWGSSCHPQGGGACSGGQGPASTSAHLRPCLHLGLGSILL